MNPFPPPGGLSVTGHVDGELLAALDLRADADRETSLRALHIVAAHRTWGVAHGFDLTVDGGPTGTGVRVAPGIAYDVRGREIVSSRAATLPPPDRGPGDGASWWADLLVARDDRLARPPGRRPGPAWEGPRWRWSFAGPAVVGEPPPGLAPDVRLGLEVPLGRVAILPPGPARRVVGPPDLTVRRTAQGLTRPRVVADQLPPGAIAASGLVGGWSAWVDTTTAGFAGVPTYLAYLPVDPVRDPGPGGGDPVAPAAVLGPFVSVSEAAPDGFRLSVRFGVAGTQMPPDPLSAPVASLPAPVDWLGIETVGGSGGTGPADPPARIGRQ